MRPQKKHRPQNPPKASVRKKRAKGKVPGEIDHGWMICGFDVSLSSMAGAAIAYDRTCDKFRGPAFVMRRWTKDDHYFDRISMAAKSFEMILDLCAELRVVMSLDEIYIAQEEPWAPGMVRGGASNALKQQAEISGAFLGGMLRYGYNQIFQISNMTWRKLVADEISMWTGEDVTTHHSKWRSGELAQIHNCKPADSGKFRAKQWALGPFSQKWAEQNGAEIPDWPDIINSKDGKISRPENSHAKAIQPDDRYDALAVMEALRLEIGSQLKNS